MDSAGVLKLASLSCSCPSRLAISSSIIGMRSLCWSSMSWSVVVTSVDAVEVSERVLMRCLLTVMGDCVIDALKALCAFIHFSVLHSAMASASSLSLSALSHVSLISLVMSSSLS